MTTDHTPPRHSSPAISAPAHRSVALTLALAALLAFSLLLPRPAAAEPLDWMPADDEIGFWGAKLPAPEGTTEIRLWDFYINSDGNSIASYSYNTGGILHYVFFNLSKGVVDKQWKGQTETEQDKLYSEVYEYAEHSGIFKTYKITFSGSPMGGHSGQTNSTPFEFGVSYHINGQEHLESIVWTKKQPHTFTCYGHHEWTNGLQCSGEIHSESLLLTGATTICKDGTFLKNSDTGPFVIRFKEDMSSPYIDQHPELVRMPFKEAYGLYIETARRLREQKPANLLEAVDEVVTPYFQEKLKNKGKK